MIHIKVPATSANLGPGFDTLGLALNLYHEISVEQSMTIMSSVHWNHSNQALLDDENFVIHGMNAVFKRYNADAIPFKLEMINCDIPASRGLGSSAAAYVSGVVAGLYLLGKPLEKKLILKIASELEGHPDNVAPAVFGGLMASCMTDCDTLCQTIHLKSPISFIALIPDYKLSTSEARAILPDSYSKSEVIFNLSRLSILLGALQNGQYEQLRHATQDLLHQPQRLSLMPDSEILIHLSQSELVYGGFVSGAGSTYMLMCHADQVHQVISLAENSLSVGVIKWSVVSLHLESEGTCWEVS